MNAKELDVVDFQKAVEIAYGERLAFLQENLIRVRTISDHCKDWFDRYYSWQPPTNSSTIDASGKGFVSIREDRRERELYAFGKRVPAIRVASSAREVNTKELFPKRVKILDRFITKAEKYLSGASSFLLPHAVVQYAVDKFEIRDWSGPESLASAYSARLLSPKDQATFLLDLKSTDKELSSRLLSILSRISGTTSVYQAVCDGNFDGLVKLLSSIDQTSLRCAQEVSSWRNALSVSDIRDFDALIEALQSIQETFFLQPVIPVLDNLDGEIWTTLNYTDWPENTWGDKEQVEEIVKSIATRQGESGTAGIPNTKPIEDSSIRFDYKEPVPDAKGHYPYLPGLKEKLHDLARIDKIIQITLESDIFYSEDKDILLYAFTGQNLHDSDFRGRKIRLKPRYADGGKNNGKITYPYEFVYLLQHMFKNEKVVFKLSTLHYIFHAEPDTWDKLQVFFYDDEEQQSKKGKKKRSAQIAQSAKATFQERMNKVMPDVFPVKRK